MHDWRSIPVVDSVVVDGLPVAIICRRPYETAVSDYRKAAAQRPPLTPVVSIPVKSANKKVGVIPEVQHGQ